ncbi:MAG: AAA family ATPase [Proteobacteria bacterium]|nr:AAA family ATPase [Pseudomonadota bacterium]
MLKELQLRGVGPAREMEVAFSKRLNIITGDNGLGKSFLLDIAWWALTRSWAGRPAQPALRLKKSDPLPKIGFTFDAKTRPVSDDCIFDRYAQTWKRSMGRPSNPGLVLYAQVDGGFSVWDPARNYWKQNKNSEEPERPRSYVFKPQEVWDGLPIDSAKKQCNGLIADWASWQREGGESFAQLSRALQALSPTPDEVLIPGKLARIGLDDVRDYPTLTMPYGHDVPVIHASAGMRRIIALAYLLVWSWKEHVIASQRLGDPPAHEIVFLIDEIESHLHPKWQRCIFDAVLSVMNALVGGKTVKNIQVIAATHSPLVLASLEPLFNPKIDALFDIDMELSEKGKRNVIIRRKQWERLGTADRWLVSDIFNLKQARSLKAEQIIEEISAAMKTERLTRSKALQLDKELASVLGETDPLWARWRFVAEEKGWLPKENGERSAADAED